MDNEEKDTVDTELEQSNIEETNSVEENTINNELNEEVSNNKNDIADLIEETPQDNNPLPPTEEVKETREDKHKGKKSKNKLIIPIIITLIIMVLAAICMPVVLKKQRESSEGGTVTKNNKASEYTMKGNSLEDFDLFFLKQENSEENKVYSPLSIKYALAMLADASAGESKDQITSIIGDYKSKKYTNSKNLSLANAFFIKNSFKANVKKEYSDLVSSKYGAEVVYDDFASAKPMNDWISDKTLGLLKDMLQDTDIKDLDFALINALAIDMDWNEVFIKAPNCGIGVSYHEYNEEFGWSAAYNVSAIKFSNTKEITGMEIMASFNNYDIIKELGEDNIRKTVGDAYREYYKKNPADTEYNSETGETKYIYYTDKEIEETLKSYLDKYIEKIKKAYGKENKTTEFELYTDDDVKVFAKDLKEYDGTTLQYVAIMPTSSELNTFIKNTDSKEIQKYIDSLKPLKKESFKDGVVTKIEGYIPKFKYEYELKLKEDLENMGIKDVFDPTKADLSSLGAPKGEFIAVAKHKANIEFTELGIKASAATVLGGAGAANGGFYYYYDVPVETIDMTFDHPYMYIIRDKETGEVWFTGTVYDPTLWEDDINKDIVGPYHKYSNYIMRKNNS